MALHPLQKLAKPGASYIIHTSSIQTQACGRGRTFLYLIHASGAYRHIANTCVRRWHSVQAFAENLNVRNYLAAASAAAGEQRECFIFSPDFEVCGLERWL